MSDAHEVQSGARAPWGIVRVVAGVAMLAAVGTQLYMTYTNAVAKGYDLATTVTNFFSFFTMLSNVAGGVLMIIGGIWLLTRGRREQFEPRWMTYAFVSLTTYLIITGVVYNLLLRGDKIDPGISQPWANEVLHLVAPIIFLFELIFSIALPRMPFKTLGIALIFPIAWIIYTLVRAESVTDPVTGASSWYPYPFLNPSTMANGYVGVGMYVVGIAAAVVLVTLVGVLRTRGRARAEDVATSRAVD